MTSIRVVFTIDPISQTSPVMYRNTTIGQLDWVAERYADAWHAGILSFRADILQLLLHNRFAIVVVVVVWALIFSLVSSLLSYCIRGVKTE